MSRRFGPCHYGMVGSPKWTRFLGNLDGDTPCSGWISFDSNGFYQGPLQAGCGHVCHKFDIKKINGKTNGVWNTSLSAAYQSKICKYLAMLKLRRFEWGRVFFDRHTITGYTGEDPPKSPAKPLQVGQVQQFQGKLIFSGENKPVPKRYLFSLKPCNPMLGKKCAPSGAAGLSQYEVVFKNCVIFQRPRTQKKCDKFAQIGPPTYTSNQKNVTQIIAIYFRHAQKCFLVRHPQTDTRTHTHVNTLPP